MKTIRTVAQLRKLVPSTLHCAHIQRGRVAVSNIIHLRDPRFLLFVGPCSIHDTEAGLEYARKLASVQTIVGSEILLVMRTYLEKPRTVCGWTGLSYDPYLSQNGSADIDTGLMISREFLRAVNNLGLYATSELLEPALAPYFEDLLVCGSIGARTVESQPHRHLVSGLELPVGLKNSTHGSTGLHAIDAMRCAQGPHARLILTDTGRLATSHTRGNPDCFVILRGTDAGPNYNKESVAQTMELLGRHGLDRGLLIDCSHANSGKDHTKQAEVLRSIIDQRIAGNKRVVGALLESFLEPGRQNIGPDLRYGVSVTDACIGWEETEQLILETFETLR
jgi:3-deoxy-7-phosphoheptulonate synthase